MGKKLKTSLITTVFNEQKSIARFLDSVLIQSQRPDEVVIIDGGSKDKTVPIIRSYNDTFKKIGIPFKIIVQKGNRSVGRNKAVEIASFEIIASSDAGCVLDKNWVREIQKPFIDKKIDVVAGYYKGLSKSVFEKCLVPYVLVMEDKIDDKTFLPSTRSMAFTKNIFVKIGGFNPRLSHNEDYDFAQKLKKKNASIDFCKSAFVFWIPRNNLKDAFEMFFRFAFGDAEASLIRGKVVLLFLRFFFGIFLIAVSILLSKDFLWLLLILIISYLIWSILKNYNYVRRKEAFVLLPVLQLTSDAAVLTGTLFGLSKTIWGIRRKL